jgi:hypothetical protein
MVGPQAAGPWLFALRSHSAQPQPSTAAQSPKNAAQKHGLNRQIEFLTAFSTPKSYEAIRFPPGGPGKSK